MSSFPFCILTLLVVVSVLMGRSSAQLSTKYYEKTCPMVFDAVKSVVKSAVDNEKRMGASLLRLHFHDCFVQGCDGSILLDDNPSFIGEKTARPNSNSLLGFNIVDQIKSKVELICPGIVSCADILAIAARDSVVFLGGPSWVVKVGRRDSRIASLCAANSGVIPPATSNLTNLIHRFQSVGLSVKDLVALSGAHTLGQTRCTSIRNRIYNETNINSSFARSRQAICPRINGVGDDNLIPLDVGTPTYFDNIYYQNLIDRKGILHSDQVLYNGGFTGSLVVSYSKDRKAFERDFVQAMIRMGDISPLTGFKGEIRKNCRRVN